MATYCVALRHTLVMLTRNESRTVAFERDVAFGGFMLHTLVQIAHLSCPWHEKWQRLFSIVYCSLGFLVPAFFPKLYIRYRESLIFCFKIGFYSFPLLRKRKGLQRVLDSAATPGQFGLIVDLVKMAWGKTINQTTHSPQRMLTWHQYY